MMVRALEVHCNFLTCGCPICFPTYKDFTLCMSTVWGRRLRNRFGENARTHAFVMERGMRVQGHRDIVFSIINYIASDDGTHRRKMNATADAANATTVTTRCGICSMGWLSHQTTSRDHTEHTHTHTHRMGMPVHTPTATTALSVNQMYCPLFYASIAKPCFQPPLYHPLLYSTSAIRV